MCTFNTKRGLPSWGFKTLYELQEACVGLTTHRALNFMGLFILFRASTQDEVEQWLSSLSWCPGIPAKVHSPQVWTQTPTETLRPWGWQLSIMLPHVGVSMDTSQFIQFKHQRFPWLLIERCLLPSIRSLNCEVLFVLLFNTGSLYTAKLFWKSQRSSHLSPKCWD